jgi:hypothetical protein
MKKSIFILLVLGIFVSGARAQNVQLSDFVGTYTIKGAPFEELIISLEGGVLMAEAEGVGKGEIVKLEEADKFKEPNNDAIILFKRDANSLVIGVVISVQGTELVGEKKMPTENEYVGKYIFEEGSEIPNVVVEIRNGKLYGDTEQGGAELKPTDKKDEFEVVGYGGTVVFERNAEGKVENLILTVQGMTMKGKR